MTERQSSGSGAGGVNPIEFLLRQERGSSIFVRLPGGDSLVTVLAVREDWQHAGALPEEPDVDVRQGMFVTNGVAIIPVLVRVESETYESCINASVPQMYQWLEDLRDQRVFLIMFYVDGIEPVRIIYVPSPFQAAFQRYAEELGQLDPWPRRAFDEAREWLCSEYPSVRALWDALAQPTDSST